MKKLNKKSILFNISLVLIAIVVLTTAFMALFVLKPFKEGIGTRAFDLIKVYQETENVLFYIDQAAKLSAQQAAYDLALNGGFELDSICGRREDYNIWSTTDPSIYCYPDNYKEIFKKDLNKNLKKHLSLLRSDKFIEFTKEFSIYPYNLTPADYEIVFVNKSIVGIPDRYAQTNFYYGRGSAKPIVGKYIINPSFNINFGYNTDEYKIIRDQAIDLIRGCSQQADLIKCINQSLPFLWTLGSCDGIIKGNEQQRFFRFCAKSNSKVLVYNSEKGSIGLEPIAYRFALYFPIQ
ncbi:hypothetical protein KY342_04765 [Candidatus Woesearchaeota archaeon]|nr:hypothetical protein [Candidatus Woesearchaeota archaeon]